MAQIYVNNALAKPKAIHVYEELTQQWKSKRVGYVYYNGEWIPFIKYELLLYQSGTEHVEFEYTGTNAQLNRRADRIELWTNLGPNNSGGTAYLKTKNRVTLTDYNKLCFDVKPQMVAADQDTGSLGIYAASGFNQPTEAKDGFGTNNVRKVVEIDISSFTGDYFVSVYLKTRYGTPSVDIYNIWLE